MAGSVTATEPQPFLAGKGARDDEPKAANGMPPVFFLAGGTNVRV